MTAVGLCGSDLHWFASGGIGDSHHVDAAFRTAERRAGLKVVVAQAARPLEEAAAVIAPGAEGLLALPYWNAAQTPYWDPLARGAVVGLHGRHTRAHVYRSLLEGVAFELRLHPDGLEAATGEPVRVIRAVGGAARSALWVQVIADVTRRPVHVCSAGEVSAAGAARLAWAYLEGGWSESLLHVFTALAAAAD